MAKKKAGELPNSSQRNHIPDKNIHFSFKYYKASNNKYCLTSFCHKHNRNKLHTSIPKITLEDSNREIEKLLDCLGEVNKKTFMELLQHRGIYHFNEINWRQTIIPGGFESLNIAVPPGSLEYEIGLSQMGKYPFRLFGFFIENVFYIVLFDWFHEVWPSKTFKK